MKILLSTLTFIARHFLFVAFVMVAGCLIWTVAYFVLLAIAIVTNQGLGGPLAWPAGIVAVIVACVFIGWGVFTPASALGAICCAVFRLPRLAAIPVVWLATMGLCFLLHSMFIGVMNTPSMPPAITVFKNSAMILSIPLGIYWWITEGPGAIFDAFRRWLRRRAGKSKPSKVIG